MTENISPYYLLTLCALVLSNAIVAMLVAGVRNYEVANGQNHNRSNSAWWVLWRYLPLILVPVFALYYLQEYLPDATTIAVTTVGGLCFGNAIFRAVLNARLDTDPGMYHLGNRWSDRVYKGVGLFLGIRPGDLAYSFEFIGTAMTYGIMVGRTLC